MEPMTTLPKALVMADSSWHSSRNLLATWPPASNPQARLLRLEPIDWQNARNRGIKPWHWGVHTHDLSSLETLITAELPPGWMKAFPRPGQWPLARTARKWLTRQQADPSRTAMVITYPYYLELARQLCPARLVYYILDDYTLYWPAKKADVTAWEARAIAQSHWTVCVAAHRARTLQETHPAHAHKIVHMPHAAPEWAIASAPQTAPGPLPPVLANIPGPILGYLGGLEDRLDWPLIARLARQFPQASIALVGPRPDLSGSQEWQVQARETLALPNVYATGGVNQQEIAQVYAAFSVNLIPYCTRHPFNIACSPTKLLDAMGSTRPTVATALPECLLYINLYDIAETHDDFCSRIEQILANDCRDGREKARWAHAQSHRSAIVMDTLFRLLWCDYPEESKQLLESLGPIG